MWKSVVAAAVLGSSPSSDSPSSLAAAASLRLRAIHKVAQTPDIMSPLEKVAEAADEAMEEAKEAGGSLAKKRAKMPEMGGTSKFRVQMCLGRPELYEHDKCMDFMTKKCEEKSTGQGLCMQFFEYLEKHCKNGHKEACKSLKELELKVARPKKETTTTTLPPAVIPPNDTNVTNATNVTNVTEPVVVAENITVESGISKKVEGPLPEHGFNEFNESVEPHKDGETHTSDWLSERPVTEETEEDATLKACKEKDTVWCKLYMKKYGL